MSYIQQSVLLIFVLTTLPVGCAAQGRVPLSSCDAKCVLELEKKALGGDVGAAKELSTYYTYENPSEVRFWDQIAAENGDAEAQRALARSMLIYSKNPRDKARGVFWLEKAAATGYQAAVDDLARYKKGGVDAINPDPRKSR